MDLPTSNLMEEFSQLRFLFPENPGLGQLDKNKMLTRTIERIILEGTEERLQQNSHLPLAENMMDILLEKPSQISSRTHLAVPVPHFFNSS